MIAILFCKQCKEVSYTFLQFIYIDPNDYKNLRLLVKTFVSFQLSVSR